MPTSHGVESPIAHYKNIGGHLSIILFDNFILVFEFAKKKNLYKEDLKNSGDKDRKYFNRPSEVTRFTLCNSVT